MKTLPLDWKWLAGVVGLGALCGVSANLSRLTWDPGPSGREWDYPANWQGEPGEWPDEAREEAYFATPALQPLLDQSVPQLGRLTFATAGWVIEQEGTSLYTITFSHISNDYNAVYSAGAGTNVVLPGVAFTVNGQNIYSAANNVLIVRRFVGPNACVFSSTTPAQENTGMIVLDGNNNGVTQPFVVRQGTVVVAHPQALGSSTGTVYLGDSWTATNARVRVLAGTNGLVMTKPLEVRDVGGVTVTLGCASGITNAVLSGPITLQRGATFLADTGAVVQVNGRVSGPGALIKGGAGTLVLASPQNVYTGGTHVLAGVVRVVTNRGMGVGPVMVSNAVLELWPGVVVSNTITARSGTVRGQGIVMGPLRLEPGSRIAPGFSVGRLTAETLLMASGSIYEVELSGSGTGQYDVVELVASGTVQSATLHPVLSYEPVLGDVLTIIEVQGSGQVSGAFAGYPEGGLVMIPGGLKQHIFRVTYIGGVGSNDMQLVCVPEGGAGQATVVLGLLMVAKEEKRLRPKWLSRF
ncbi:MAG: autotransporter-associated beta strand repeat-containing protein [bacterium]|nr:autotransporter-associated beta strand repeat-containing protein [bacterium]